MAPTGKNLLASKVIGWPCVGLAETLGLLAAGGVATTLTEYCLPSSPMYLISASAPQVWSVAVAAGWAVIQRTAERDTSEQGRNGGGAASLITSELATGAKHSGRGLGGGGEWQQRSQQRVSQLVEHTHDVSFKVLEWSRLSLHIIGQRARNSRHSLAERLHKRLASVSGYGRIAHGRLLAAVWLCLLAQSYRRLRGDRAPQTLCQFMLAPHARQRLTLLRRGATMFLVVVAVAQWQST